MAHSECDWVFVIDEDVFLCPPLLREFLADFSPEEPIALGTLGCGSVIPGFCGGGGHAVSRAAVKRLVAAPNFCDNCIDLCAVKEPHCDIVTAHMLKHNASVKLTAMPTLHPWGIRGTEIEAHKPLPNAEGNSAPTAGNNVAAHKISTLDQKAECLERLNVISKRLQLQTNASNHAANDDPHNNLFQPLLPSADMISDVRDAIETHPNNHRQSSNNHSSNSEEWRGSLQSILNQMRHKRIASLHCYGGGASTGKFQRLEDKMAFLQFLFDVAGP